MSLTRKKGAGRPWTHFTGRKPPANRQPDCPDRRRRLPAAAATIRGTEPPDRPGRPVVGDVAEQRETLDDLMRVVDEDRLSVRLMTQHRLT
jgi:hypothetical protein